MLVRDPREISDALVTSVLDFCRRAQRPAAPGEVRLALARLGEERDREILRIASQAPPAQPLSPHAFMDWVLGMPAEQAAALEEAGAYLAVAREAAQEAIDLQIRRDREAAALTRPKPAARRRKKAGAQEPTPLIRRRAKAVEAAPPTEPAGEAPPPEAPTEPGTEPLAEAPPPEAPPPRPGRRPAQPTFGRFVSGAPAKRPFEELEGPEGAEILRGLITETHGSVAHLADRLNAAWAPRRGAIGPEQIGRLLARHGLEESRRKAERAQIRALLRRNRGYDRPVARAWRLTTGELRQLIADYGLIDEVKQLRARAREEALAETRLDARLSLLHRHADRLRALGVHRTLDREVLRELRRLVDALPLGEEPQTPEVLLEMLRRQEGFDRSLWRWAVDEFGLIGAAARRLGIPLARRPRPTPRFGAPRGEPRFGERGHGQEPRFGERGPGGAPRFGDRPPRGPHPRPPRRDRGHPKR